MTRYQKYLLNNEQIYGKENLKNHLEKIIRNKILIEIGFIDKKKDVLIEESLNYTQINYLLNSRDESHKKNINKYNVANYYFQLAKEFNRIALARNISRNELWKIINKNIIIKEYNNTKQRFYKFIFRGEIIPSTKFVENTLINNEDLPSYLSIIYLDEKVTAELEEAYQKLTMY